MPETTTQTNGASPEIVPDGKAASKESQLHLLARHSLSGAFAFLSGYADIVFFQFYTLFVTMMTGNTFLLGKALVTGETLVVRLLVIAGYLVGVMLYGYVDRTSKRFGAATKLAPVIALISTLVSVVPHFFHEDEYTFAQEKKFQLHAPLCSMMFGIQSSVASNGVGASTSMVTAHLTNLAKAIKDIRHRSSWRQAFHKNSVGLTVIVFMVAGAAFGQVVMQECDEKDCLDHLMWPFHFTMAVLLLINDHIFHKKNQIDVVGIVENVLSHGATHAAELPTLDDETRDRAQARAVEESIDSGSKGFQGEAVLVEL